MEKEIIHKDLQNEHYLNWRSFLKESEGWSREQIADYQLNELKRIVKYAYENTAACRRLYDDAGVTPESITTIDDFRRLPFVEKEMIRDNLEDFSADVEDREYATTGGSATGIPTGFYRDPISFAKELASKAHQYYRVGWKEGDRQLVLRGLQINTEDHMEYIPEFNELRCSSYYLVPEWMEVYRKRALDYKPEWIRCYPSTGFVFARFIKETRRPFPRVKGVLCASENLYDFQKELFYEVFGAARVFSHYGHSEMAVLAGFCEYEDTYHVLPQYGYAELIGRDGQLVKEPGQMGEIVGTSFIMHATPFVRYRTRDFAVLKGWGCPACRRPYQIWERMEGRAQEFFVTGGGRYISATAAIAAMHGDIWDHIEQYQFFQEKLGRVTFKYIPKETCDQRIVEDVRARLIARFQNDMEIEMEPVEQIPTTARGKRLILIQKIKIPYSLEVWETTVRKGAV